MSAEIVHLGRSERHGLDVEALEGDLAVLWKDAGAEHGARRACLANLVVAVGPEGDPVELLEDLARRHPVRAILVHVSGALPPGRITAWVTAACRRRPREQALVCSEAIVLEAGPGAESRLPSAVRALTLGGLPRAALVPHGTPAAHPWTEELSRELDVLLADSAGMAAHEAADFWSHCVRKDGGPRHRDLAWTRLTDWRRALALPFEAGGERLAGLSRARIVVADDPGARAVAALLTAWLAGRLGWALAGSDEAGWTFLRAGARVRVDAAVEPAGDDPARVRGITFSFAGGEAIAWRRVSAEKAIVITGTSGERAVRLDRSVTTAAAAVARELHRHGPDEATSGILASAARLLAAGGGAA